ncbi:hypothetical protein QCA50_007604 [Cerrena zonata]|uniref:Helicase C-terminal domain-containing protein n=1 Tax=Cerrena zonata TaxID=2478898 RepID=A0AAW0G5J8_9APHY
MLRLSRSIPLTCQAVRSRTLLNSIRLHSAVAQRPSPFTHSKNAGNKKADRRQQEQKVKPGKMRMGLNSKAYGHVVTIPGAQTGVSLTPETVLPYLSVVGNAWISLPHITYRLRRFGIPRDSIKPALSAFTRALEDGTVLSTLEFDETRMLRLITDLSDPLETDALDLWLTRLFYEWASHPSIYPILRKFISEDAISIITGLFRAADLSSPATQYPITRSSPMRKVIMHVGPTNSGKTHNALRALAAARMGCYAGPLRLLAHEIFERLNKGQIMPLGVEIEEEGEVEPDTDSNFDINPKEGKKVVVRKDGNPKWARACNLLTGEENKIVEPGAGLLSCTVEMLNTSVRYDVVVVDEIQLLSDKDRGGSWSSAVLGVNAAELHLCGEEAAVPLVEQMLRDTGDELIVNRYERLTPLKVADESLGGDLKKIQKGDCVVTFSRSNIFALKREVEKQSGLKCAVAYGRLPPEIRSEQAALFNDLASGYDVLIGSDAIGMGLNLKVKRIVFESITKYDGKQERPLSIPQIKQIAGRAGRFGLHEKDSVGICTTLYEDDLPILRDSLPIAPEPLRMAYLQAGAEQYSDILQALPPNSTLSTAMLACKYVAKLHPAYEYQDVVVSMTATDYMDKVTSGMTLPDKFMMQQVPAPWRDGLVVTFMTNLLQLYVNDLRVDLRKLLSSTEFLDILEDARETIRTRNKAKVLKSKADTLVTLESLHKCLIAYIWLAFRNPVSFPDNVHAVELKQESEKAMEWYLEILSEKSGPQKKKKLERLQKVIAADAPHGDEDHVPKDS